MTMSSSPTAAASVLEADRKKQQYISKLKRISKQFASSNESTPNASPRRPSEASPKEESPQRSIESSAPKDETHNQERQIHAYKKLKALISKIERESPKTTSTKSPVSNSICVTPDSTQAASYNSPSSKLNNEPNTTSNEKKSFNLQSLLQCCGELSVEDSFTADDGIDHQLVLDRECDDTTLLDEWSLDVSSTPSNQSRRDVNTSTRSATYNQGNNQVFFRGEPCEI